MGRKKTTYTVVCAECEDESRVKTFTEEDDACAWVDRLSCDAGQTAEGDASIIVLKDGVEIEWARAVKFTSAAPAPRKAGRPKGSKNKPAEHPPMPARVETQNGKQPESTK